MVTVCLSALFYVGVVFCNLDHDRRIFRFIFH